MLEQMGLLPPCASTTHARLVDHGRIIIASGPAAGLELGLHLLRRAGHDEFFVSEVARLMDYTIGYEMYLEDVERHT